MNKLFILRASSIPIPFAEGYILFSNNIEIVIKSFKSL